MAWLVLPPRLTTYVPDKPCMQKLCIPSWRIVLLGVFIMKWAVTLADIVAHVTENKEKDRFFKNSFKKKT